VEASTAAHFFAYGLLAVYFLSLSFFFPSVLHNLSFSSPPKPTAWMELLSDSGVFYFLFFYTGGGRPLFAFPFLSGRGLFPTDSTGLNQPAAIDVSRDLALRRSISFSDG